MLKVYKRGSRKPTSPEFGAIDFTSYHPEHWKPFERYSSVRELLTFLRPYEGYLPLNKRMEIKQFANILMDAWMKQGRITIKVDEFGDPLVDVRPEKEFIALQMLMAEHKTIIRTL